MFEKVEVTIHLCAASCHCEERSNEAIFIRNYTPGKEETAYLVIIPLRVSYSCRGARPCARPGA